MRTSSSPVWRRCCGGQVRRRGDEPVALDGRGEDDGAAPVVDVAAAGRLLDLDGRLGDGLRGEHVALRATCQYASRPTSASEATHEDDQQEQQARARIRPTQHRFGRCAQRAGRTMGSPELAEPGIDGRACGSPARCRAGSGRSGGPARASRAGRGRPAAGRCRSSSPTRGRPGRARRRRAGTRRRSTPRTRPEVVGPSAGPDGRAHAAPAERRALRDARATRRARGAMVRGRAPS